MFLVDHRAAVHRSRANTTWSEASGCLWTITMGTGLIERWASFRRPRYLRHGGSHPTLPPVSTVVIVSADCCASTHWRLERGDLRTPHDLCWSPLRRDTGASPSDMLFAICGVCRCRGLERKAARQLNSVRWINRPYRSTIPRWGMWNESAKNGIAPPNSSRWCTNLERPRIAGPSNE